MGYPARDVAPSHPLATCFTGLLTFLKSLFREHGFWKGLLGSGTLLLLLIVALVIGLVLLSLPFFLWRKFG